MARRTLTDSDYTALAAWRYALRRFLRFSENAARRAGVSPSQYQLMLFIRGFRGGPPAIADLAERLQVHHQSAVGLVDRSETAGLVRRVPDARDRRRVRVVLTPRGATILRRLVVEHFRTLAALGEQFVPPVRT
jgi:DNA-binding MarR family transcriptional regulator